MNEPLDIQALRALLEKATPVESSVTTLDTMRFYAAMHNAAPQLLDAVEELERIRKEQGGEMLLQKYQSLIRDWTLAATTAQRDRDAALKRCAELEEQNYSLHRQVLEYLRRQP